MRVRADHPALVKGVTIHPRAVKAPTDVKSILKAASDNDKLGKGSMIITKGKWRGMPMFQMSLEERATCPSSCQQWANCFGNNMAFAHRIDHRHPEFLSRLEDEIDDLAHVYQHGFVIRPHVLGDYYSLEYVEFWVRMTEKHKQLRIFGYTHNLRDSEIGRVIQKWNEDDRVWIRFSDQYGPMSANVGTDHDGFTCPEQTGATKSCLTCGACWSTTRAVNFLEH